MNIDGPLLSHGTLHATGGMTINSGASVVGGLSVQDDGFASTGGMTVTNPQHQH